MIKLEKDKKAKIQRTHQNSKKLTKSIQEHLTYKNHRAIAGRALGYSGVRIWAHEHPVSAVIIGSTGVGAIRGLIYNLVK